MRSAVAALIACMALTACAGPSPEKSGDAARDTMTKGARDSALARSRIPNAKAVGRAQDAAQTSQQRTSTFDSMQAAIDSIHE